MLQALTHAQCLPLYHINLRTCLMPQVLHLLGRCQQFLMLSCVATASLCICCLFCSSIQLASETTCQASHNHATAALLPFIKGSLHCLQVGPAWR